MTQRLGIERRRLLGGAAAAAVATAAGVGPAEAGA
ncbi:MAG: twin-arginine translocation signal domain-containing protein, partial [Actinocrinis sp.]